MFLFYELLSLGHLSFPNRRLLNCLGFWGFEERTVLRGWFSGFIGILGWFWIVSVNSRGVRNSSWKIKVLWQAKWSLSYLQIDLLDLLRLVLTLSFHRFRSGCVDSSQSEMATQVNSIQRTISLTFECSHITVKIYCQVVPWVLFETQAWRLYEKWLNFSFSSRRRKNDAPFSLYCKGSTLVKSETTSSILQGIDGKRKIWKTKYCWIK